MKEQPVDVPAFDVDRYMVTNANIWISSPPAATKASLWKDPDWAWRERTLIEHPVFWARVEGGWTYRTMFQEIPLPLDWPVYVSHAEASAFANGGKRLPTEAEWHRAAYSDVDGAERQFPWGSAAPSKRGNFDFQRWDATPVGSFPNGESAFGVSDLIGNGWEWTNTLFSPLKGFSAFPFYRGYSADFFDGKTLRDQRRFGAHSRQHASSIVSQLVPTALPVCLCGVPVRTGTVKTEGGMLTYPIAPTKSKSNDFAADVRAGLEMRGQKELPSKYLYDDVGSALFEVISVLPEYGLTRADERLLRRSADDIVRRVPKPVVVAELGSGSGKKTRWLLEALSAPAACVLVARSKFLRRRWRCANGN